MTQQTTNLFKYETHFHTQETSPCARVPAKKAVRLYKEAGYTGIVVTDHYYRLFFNMHPFCSKDRKIDLFLKGYNLAMEEGQKLGLDIFHGMEIRFREDPNDYLVYGINEKFLREHKKLHNLTLQQFRELTSGLGIAIVQAHPFRPGLTPAPPSLLDGIEVFNGNPRHDSSNHLALKYAEENGLIGISGSDFHRPQDVARGGIVTKEKIPAGRFAEWILNKKNFECIRTE